MPVLSIQPQGQKTAHAKCVSTLCMSMFGGQGKSLSLTKTRVSGDSVTSKCLGSRNEVDFR